jgi:hypothetical protein
MEKFVDDCINRLFDNEDEAVRLTLAARKEGKVVNYYALAAEQHGLSIPPASIEEEMLILELGDALARAAS